jgi:patatin-like phospholipase/acyl hydrolase
VTGRASHLFRTPHHGDLTVDANTLAAHVAVSTAAAPTYFKSAIAVRMGLEHNYFDGGVWANSPTLAAIVEAITFLKVPMERLDVLSIGTTEEPFDATAGANGGLLAWRNLIIKVMMSAQQESSLKLAEHLVSQARFLRVNHVAPHGRYHLDSPTEISELASLGQNIGLDSRTLGQVKSRFLTGVNAAPWTKY